MNSAHIGFIKNPFLLPLIILFIGLTWYSLLELFTKDANKWFNMSVQFMVEVGSFIYVIMWSFEYQDEYSGCDILNPMLYFSFLLIFGWISATIAKTTLNII